MKISTPQNEAGWNLAPIDPSTGKIPPNLYDAGGSSSTSITVGAGLSGNGTQATPLTLDLSNYTLSEGKSVNINTQEAITIISNTNIKISNSSHSLTITNNGIEYDGHIQNSASGLVVLGADGKIPSNLYDAGGSTEIDWSNVTAEDVSISSNNTIMLTAPGDVYISSGDSAISLSSNNVSLNGTTLYWNDNAQNTANGPVVLGNDGKIPVNLYDAGGQSVFQVESFPASGENNSLYIDKNTSEVKGYFNGAWQDVSYECVDAIDDTATVETIPSTKAVKDYVDAKANVAYAMQPAETTTKDIVFKDNVSIYNIDISSATTFTFDFSQLSSDACYTFELWVKMSTVSTLTFPSNVAWLDGSAPDMSESSTYCIVIRKFPETFVTSGNAVAIMNLAYKYNL